jgi:adenine-specific DNA-methyltransferase
MDKLKMHSLDMTQQNIDKLLALFPNCKTEKQSDSGELEVGVDFDLLKQELSKHIVEGPQERYQLNWPGKKEALLTANAPIAKTLRPCREESVDFDTTENLFIEGDNLDALKLLQETYLGKVKMIYIDPPYNTGNDFIYDDEFAEDIDGYLLKSNQIDVDGGRLIANTESNGRFHSDWLTMIYSRLKLARNLLSNNGVIFISIGDDEQASLKKLCDEVFGIDNFLGCACRVSKKANNQGDYWSPNYDYLLTYARTRHDCDVFFGGVNYSAYDQVETIGARKGEKYQLVRLYMTSLDPMRGCTNQRYYIEAPDGTMLIPPGNVFPSDNKDASSAPPETGDDKVWRWGKDRYLQDKQKIVVKAVRSSNLVDSNGDNVKWNVFTKTYLNDVIENATAKPNSLVENYINQKSSHELKDLAIPFSFAKPSSLIEYLCEISRVQDRDIVMDFFAGSGSTGHGVLKLNAKNSIKAKFVMVQLDEKLDFNDKNQKSGYMFCEKNGFKKTIPSISKERIRRAGIKIKKENPDAIDLDIGFRVLKIDSSNMNDVHYTPDAVSKADMFNQVEHIKADRSAEDLLFQVMLDWGVALSLPIRKETIEGKAVYFVNDDGQAPCDLLACFDKEIDEPLINALAAQAPLRVVFRDDGFVSDSIKINVEQIFKQLSPTTDIKVI